jgi:hypothetical protein
MLHGLPSMNEINEDIENKYMSELKSNEDPMRKQQDIIKKLKSTGQPFIYDSDDELTDEYAHFYFLGSHEGKEALFDTVLYTLRMQHETELFEIAEQKASHHFPNYKKIQYEEDGNGNLKALGDQEEEIGLYIAEVMLELEEEDEVKVKEHVDLDLNHDCGIALDVGLHLEMVTTKIIESFIRDFNADSIVLDPGLYSFQNKTDLPKP